MADENEPHEPDLGPLSDTTILWPIGLWGGAAIVALAAAIVMTQTDSGSRQLQMAFSTAPETTQRATQADFAPPKAPDTKPDTKVSETKALDLEAQRRQTAQLEAQIRDLAADRERLSARIASLEQNLSDVTGSIKRQLEVAATAKPVPPAPVSPAVATAKTAAERFDDSARPDLVAKTETRPEPRVAPATPAAAPSVAVQATPQAAPQGPQELPQITAKVVPPPPEQPQIAPPLAAPIGLPSMQVAAAIATEPAPAATGTEIAVDLGGARSMDIMQARWLAVKANFGPLLQGMRPLVAHETRPGSVPLRLIVGPIPNGAAAAQICKRLAASKVTCRATRFAGEQLTFE